MKKEDVSNAEILKIVSFIKDRVVGLEEKVDRLERRMLDFGERLVGVEGRITGLYNLMDAEIDRRKALEVRISKVEVGKNR